jgi:hypothetical protein
MNDSTDGHPVVYRRSVFDRDLMDMHSERIIISIGVP